MKISMWNILSQLNYDNIVSMIKEGSETNRALGLVDMENPLLRIVTLALPVIPNVKMSDLGMVDVLKKELIPLFA